MGLRARLMLLVVVGLLLIAASAVYTEMLPWQPQRETVGATRTASGRMSSERVSCPLPGDGCGNKDSAGNCTIGGCEAAKTAEQNLANQQHAGKLEAEQQPEKAAAGEQTAKQNTDKSRAEAAE